jgi:archaetidylinositol phosphate synthase
MTVNPNVPVRMTESLLGGIERPLLLKLARAMPAWVASDMLTVLGIVGAALTCAGYILCNLHVGFVFLASSGLIINWFGDSLDGTLARVRRIERPRYGFLVDHSSDLASQLLIGLGMGMSPFVNFDVACIILIVYLAFSAFTYMKTIVSGEFQISFGGIGPTEVRFALIAGNTFMLWYTPKALVTLWEPMSAVDLLVLGVVAVEALVLAFSVLGEVRRIRQSEPPL